MTAKQKSILRAMPTTEVVHRCQRAKDLHQVRAFWRYYFELTLRKMEGKI